jgi:cellobiose phosphorylase
LYALATDLDTSGIYPGLPEYFNATGKGLYPFLTGSASWMLLTVLTEMFGVRGEIGDLVIEPKLAAEQFAGSGCLSCETNFRHLRVNVKIVNEDRLDYGDYCIGSVAITPGISFACEKLSSSIRIAADDLQRCADPVLDICMTLVPHGADLEE